MPRPLAYKPQPLAYEPQQGYAYQILSKYGTQPYEHCDYAVSTKEKNEMMAEYRMAYGNEFTFKVILLPKKYHGGVDGLLEEEHGAD